jgi:hypothetical protein
MNIRFTASRFLFSTFLALACASTACTVSRTGTGPVPTNDGGASSPDDKDDDGKDDDRPPTQKPTTGAGSSSCQQIFACALECQDTDCEDACYAKGSTAGKGQVDALIQCSKDNACEDGDCIVTNCSSEYDACE